MIVLSKPADWNEQSNWYSRVVGSGKERVITSLEEGKVVIVLWDLNYKDDDELERFARFMNERTTFASGEFGEKEFKEGLEKLRSLRELLCKGCDEVTYSGSILNDFRDVNLEIVGPSTYDRSRPFVLTFPKRSFLPPKSVKRPRNIQELAKAIPTEQWCQVLTQLVSRMFDEGLSVWVVDEKAVSEDISLSEESRKALLQEIKEGGGFAWRAALGQRVVYERSWQQGGTH